MGLTAEERSERANELEKLKITNESDEKPYVFVSYASDNWRKVFVDCVIPLQQEYGMRVYADKAFDETNEIWMEAMSDNLRHSNVMLAFVSQKYIESYACFFELMTAVRTNISIVFIYIDDENNLKMTKSEKDEYVKLEEDIIEDILETGQILTNETNTHSISLRKAMRGAYSIIKRKVRDNKLSKRNVSDAMLHFLNTAQITRNDIKNLYKLKETIKSECIENSVFDDTLTHQPETNPASVESAAQKAETAETITQPEPAHAPVHPVQAPVHPVTEVKPEPPAAPAAKAEPSVSTKKRRWEFTHYFTDPTPEELEAFPDLAVPSSASAEPAAKPEPSISTEKPKHEYTHFFTDPDPEEPEYISDTAAPSSASAEPASSRSGAQVTYTLFGSTKTSLQSEMMYDVFGTVLERYPDKYDKILSLNCVSDTDLSLKTIIDKKAQFNSCKTFKTVDGRILCVGTGYSMNDKLKHIARLLNICGLDSSVLTIEGHELPEKVSIPSGEASGKTNSSGTGISYELYGERCSCKNQTEMMVQVFEKVISRHPDKINEIMELNCVSLTDYSQEKKSGASFPSQFRTGQLIKAGDRSVFIGTSYGLNAKYNLIKQLFSVCGEAADVFSVTDI